VYWTTVQCQSCAAAVEQMGVPRGQGAGTRRAGRAL